MSNFDTLFPTIIYKKDNPKLISESVKILAKKICFEQGDYAFQSKCISTIKTNNNILELPDFYRIKKAVEESIKESIKNYDKTKFKITNIATDTDVKPTNYFPIYKLNQDIFDDFKNDYNSDGDPFTFQLGDDYYSNMLSKDVKNEKKFFFLIIFNKVLFVI